MCKTPTRLCTDEALESVFLLGTLVLCLLISTVRGGISPSQTQTDLLPSFRHECETPVNSVLGRERNEAATSEASTTANAPKSLPDPALQLLALLLGPLNQTQQLLSLTHLSAISANQILKVTDLSVVDYGPSVSAAKDEEVLADPYVIAADPNTPAIEDIEIAPDPNIAATDANMPAVEDTEVARDPNVVTPDSDARNAQSETTVPKPEIPLSEPDAWSFGPEETGP